MAVTDTTLTVQAGELNSVSSRYHDLWLRRWLYDTFFVREGYPVPVVFASPSDAFSQFSTLWSLDKNPFRYLLDLKDGDGTPLYEPHPSPVRYPLISVYKTGTTYRTWQNFSYHRWRHINWPTVAADVAKCDLGNVMTSYMPMAWDFKYQIDYYSMRPDTQAYWIEKLMWAMYRTGGVPQTWICVNYPGWGPQMVRLRMEPDIQNNTPDAPNDGEHTEYRSTVNVILEGFSVDLNYQIYPALWELVFRNSSDINDPATSYTLLATEDLRFMDANPTLDSRPNVPAEGDCQQELADYGETIPANIGAGGIESFNGEDANSRSGVGGAGLSTSAPPVTTSYIIDPNQTDYVIDPDGNFITAL